MMPQRHSVKRVFAARSATLLLVWLGFAMSAASQTLPAASSETQAEAPFKALNGAQGFSAGLERGGLDYHAVERSSSGGVTNQERGHLPLVAATLRWQSDAWSIQGRLSRAKDDVGYEGYTQIGIPLTTSTRLALHQAEVRASYQAPTTGSLRWRADMGIDHLRIDRDIQPGLGSLPLQEVLNSTRMVLGLGVQQDLSGLVVVGRAWPVQLSAGVDVLPALRNRLAVNSYGQFDPITLVPSRQTDWRWQAKAQVSLTPRATLSLGVVQEHFQPGSSSVQVWRRNGVAVAGVRYPGSEQSWRRWSVGLSWVF